MSRKSSDSLAFGMGTLAGMLAGVALAVLFSPKSGVEMRKDLSSAAKQIADEKVPSKVEYTKKISTAVIAKLQYKIESQFNKVIDTIKSGRMAAAKRKEEQSAYKYQEI